jgi:hypothetical protein
LPKQMEFLDVEVEWIRILSSMMLQLWDSSICHCCASFGQSNFLKILARIPQNSYSQLLMECRSNEHEQVWWRNQQELMKKVWWSFGEFERIGGKNSYKSWRMKSG